MKRLLFVLFILISSSVVSNAQLINPQPQDPGSEQAKMLQESEAMWNMEYARLLSEQNDRLISRRNALITTLSGVGVSFVGVLVGAATGEQDSYGNVSLGAPGVAILGVGEIVTAVGGIWTLINEFNMLKAQKRLNDHLLLKYSPTGLSLTF
ncbi:MAG: hypothetical protein IJT26_02405 [Bacteroidales bacterium]|nr:hypothetical protein [Bacteroidales bacterium]